MKISNKIKVKLRLTIISSKKVLSLFYSPNFAYVPGETCFYSSSVAKLKQGKVIKREKSLEFIENIFFVF